MLQGSSTLCEPLPAFAMGALLLVLLTRSADFNFNRLMTRWAHKNALAMASGAVLKFLAVMTAIGALLVPVLHPPPGKSEGAF